jgi:hypothetical protein
MTAKKYGWYSEKQAAYTERVTMFGKASNLDRRPNLYTTPDGRVVVVTQVTATPTDPENCWGDSMCLGEVVKWLGKASKSLCTTGGQRNGSDRQRAT